MRIRVSAPNSELRDRDMDAIEKDLQKIARRLREFDDREEVLADLRVKEKEEGPNHHITLEITYGRHRLIANVGHTNVHQGIREARDEILRQINDHSRRGHSSFVKRR